MQKLDPIFIAPRLVEGGWGRSNLGMWLQPNRDSATVAEAWLCHPANLTDSGPLGHRLTRQNTPMVGDVGRAPPMLRMVFPGCATTLQPSSPLSFWSVLDPGKATEPLPYKAGDRICAYEGAGVALAAGSVALEVSSTFQPINEHENSPSLITLPPASQRTRATLFRDAALSVERWRLPTWSKLVPDGDCCHVLVALTRGVQVDGRRMQPGEAVFVPAIGRAIDITAIEQAVALVTYPSARPTSIWRHTPGPDPEPAVLSAVFPKRPPPHLDEPDAYQSAAA